MQLEDRQGVGLRGDRLLDGFGVFVEDFFPAWNDLREDREAVAGRGLGKDRPYRPCSSLSWKYPPLGIAMAAGFVQSCVLVSLDIMGPS